MNAPTHLGAIRDVSAAIVGSRSRPALPDQVTPQGMLLGIDVAHIDTGDPPPRMMRWRSSSPEFFPNATFWSWRYATQS
jgi:hypothetical protein